MMYGTPSTTGPSSNRSRSKSGYRSARSVRGQRDVVPTTTAMQQWTRTKTILISVGAFVMTMTTIVPIVMLESETFWQPHSFKSKVSLHGLISTSGEIFRDFRGGGNSNNNKKKKEEEEEQPSTTSAVVITSGNQSNSNSQKLQIHLPPADFEGHHVQSKSPHHDMKKDQVPPSSSVQGVAVTKQMNDTSVVGTKEQSGRVVPPQSPKVVRKKQQLARGVAGLPMAQTPALVGARPGHIECDVDVDYLAYWNDPQGKFDRDFVSPFATPPEHGGTTKTTTKYLTFQPDSGGWNNIRMSMEIIFVMAAATGRTLVLPPKAPFYLLGYGEAGARSFGSFYDVDKPSFQKQVKVITMEEFFEREGRPGGLLNITVKEYNDLKNVSQLCVYRAGAYSHCDKIYSRLEKLGYKPEMEASRKNCLVFDSDVFAGREVSPDLQERVNRFCGKERTPVYFDQSMSEPQLMYLAAHSMEYRLLNHFYSFLFFTDPVVDNHYKRFVRDFLHYRDSVYCAAGKVVRALDAEGKEWSTMHVRRGDLQYKQVKIPAEEWYDTLHEVWNEGEILYIATDERNRSFFDPIKKYHEVRFLDDYWDVAKLGDLDPSFISMVDTIVASHGRSFSGTWFSTFTGYITRMRGYLGYSLRDSWYGWKPRKEMMHEYKYPQGNYGAREWPLGWVAIDGDKVIEHEGVPVVEQQEVASDGVDDNKGGNHSIARKREIPSIKLSDMKTDEGVKGRPLSRGLAGRPIAETPALIGGSRGTIQCDVNVDSMAYWNDPPGSRDQDFVSPFRPRGEDEKYITFTIDRGGWNNIRMSMEIIFVIAAATGRTLVLPPKEPLYRLAADNKHKERGFADFFPLGTPEFAKRVKTISTAEFVRREGGPNGRVPIPESMRANVTSIAEVCEMRKKSPIFCGHIAEYLNRSGFVPDARASDYCIVFDKDLYNGKPMTDEIENSIASFCGKRKRYTWTADINDNVLIHFRAGDKDRRLLSHFYGFIHFTDPALDNFYKRFVRDFLHYNDQIYCAAGKIVKALQAEGKDRGFPTDDEGGGGYSAMHIRRGDFQYKTVKLPAEEWYENTKEIWKPNEIIFIATDERNMSFFDPIAEHHNLRFLDDYWDLAKLGDIDPNYFGMIDTIVSSRGRAFAGTWFSTFTGYINRMRGYHGMTMNNSWYSFLERKTKLHTWEKVDTFAYAYEWPDGWIGIDADVWPEKDNF